MFGHQARNTIPEIKHAPQGAHWHKVRPRKGQRVRAWLAAEDCEVVSSHGPLSARAGKDVIVAYGPRDLSVVRRDLFERTYERVSKGVYEKRADIRLRYFEIDQAAVIQTLEGPVNASPGDWIVEGLDGELWPVAPDKAKQKYKRH